MGYSGVLSFIFGVSITMNRTVGTTKHRKKKKLVKHPQTNACRNRGLQLASSVIVAPHLLAACRRRSSIKESVVVGINRMKIPSHSIHSLQQGELGGTLPHKALERRKKTVLLGHYIEANT